MSGPLPVPPEGETTPPAPPTPPPAERYPFWNYVDVLLLFGLALPLLVASNLVVVFFFRLIHWTPQAKALGPIAMMFLFYGLWFLLLMQLIRIRYDRPFWNSLAWIRPPRPLSTYISWGILTAATAIAIVVVLRPPAIKTPLDELLNDRLSIALMFVFGVTLGPLCEELSFRGVLMPLLVRSFGAVWGVVLQAVPFALLHGPEYSWSWQRMIPILVAGISFGWARYASGSTLASTLAHGGYNLVVFVISAAAQR